MNTDENLYREGKAWQERRIRYERAADARNAFRAVRGIRPTTASGPLIAYLKTHYREEWERRFRHPVFEPEWFPESWPWYRIDMTLYESYFERSLFRLPDPSVQDLSFSREPPNLGSRADEAVTLTRTDYAFPDGRFVRYFLGLSAEREVWYGAVSYRRRLDPTPSPAAIV